jgi:hypothetical protein
VIVNHCIFAYNHKAERIVLQNYIFVDRRSPKIRSSVEVRDPYLSDHLNPKIESILSFRCYARCTSDCRSIRVLCLSRLSHEYTSDKTEIGYNFHGLRVDHAFFALHCSVTRAFPDDIKPPCPRYIGSVRIHNTSPYATYYLFIAKIATGG